ncbi:hypothetical protein PQQ51_02575 [Paraburkholderia xenovorans]|uniref:hypothetical protein n=1 Tax=Paraburkholderia xenovorans TaxID=36873 RepID=UPI0038BD1B02
MMAYQEALFALEPLALVHDAEGGIRYLPEAIPASSARLVRRRVQDVNEPRISLAFRCFAA